MAFSKRQGSEEVQGSPQHREGFDNPLSDPDSDMLGRKKIVNQVYAHLTNLEPEWSVRVGLLAPWGEGKTTVCKWVASRAKKDGHIPVWYSPWSAKTDSELWLGFYSTLLTALKAEGIDLNQPGLTFLEGLKSTVKDFLRNVGHRHQELVSGLSQIHQISQAGLGIMHTLIKVTPQDLEIIRAKLNGRRILIIIDDLDRVEASLIPRLFMSLRDLMDLEGFSFLLPFDERFVADALAEYSKAEGYGEKFPEKILDFRVRLPAATKDQAMAFFSHELKQYCSFIRPENLEGLEEFLPSNPRKLKALVRGLRVFDAEGKRHRPGEIDWKTLIFAQMIKMEAEEFFQAFEKDTFLREEESHDPFDNSRFSPWMIAYMEKDENKGKEEEIKRIVGLLDNASVQIPESRERLIKLCEGWRTSYGYTGQQKISYALKLLNQPETLTWAEFDDFWSVWTEAQTFPSLFPWISAHARKVEKSECEVVRELLITLTYQYNQHLDRAASTVLQREQEACIHEAHDVLVVLELFLDENIPNVNQKEFLTTEVFEKFFDVTAHWNHFTANKSDREIRLKEDQFLKKWVQKANDLGLALPYIAVFKKLTGYGAPRQTNELLGELRVLAGSGLESAALKVLQKEDGIQEIIPSWAGLGTKDVLVDVNNKLWTPEGSSPAERILSSAPENAVIQKNALELLSLLRKTSNEGAVELTSAQVREFYKHPVLVGAIWQAAIATPLQFRQLEETRKLRAYLVSMGVGEYQLPTPAWLLVTKENVQSQQTCEAEKVRFC